MATKRYNSKSCVVTYGEQPITGFGESMIEATKTENNGSFSIGAQGDAIYNESNNHLGQVTVTLQANSPSNAYLTKAAKSGTEATLVVIDKSLGERITCPDAIITKYPDISKGTEAGERQYVFESPDYTVDIE